MEHKFQINLGGIIDLLSNHLYSSPSVYVRELLQNGVDAISARRRLEPEHEGSIAIDADLTLRGNVRSPVLGGTVTVTGSIVARSDVSTAANATATAQKPSSSRARRSGPRAGARGR